MNKRMNKGIGYASVLTLFICAALLAWRAGAGAQAPAVPPGQQPAAAGGRPGGGGGGRGGAALTLYNQSCADCHGTTDGKAARAPSLFDERWLKGTTDDKIAAAIRNGVRNTEMDAFTPAQVTDDQIFQLIAFIRTTSSTLIPKPEFVPDAEGQVIASEKQRFKIEVVTKGVETPWGLAFLPDGRLLVTERPGKLRIVDKTGKLSDPVKGTPTPHVQQDGGYLDVTVHPQYARTGWVYLSYSEVRPGFTPPPAEPAPAPPEAAAPARGGRGRGPQIPSNTVIVRGKINANNEWTDQQVIYRVPDDLYVAGGTHFGSRFIWDRTNHLFFSFGERGTMLNAQDLKNPLGKIHRVNDDGSVPRDNPFVNRADALPSIWSYGHRNPQGFAWDPITGKLWESEHGPSGGDEINIIEPGHNYGWGVISHGVQAGITARPRAGMESPIVYFTPSIGPSGIAFYTGTRYPGWRNSSLFVSGLVGQQLRRLEVKDGKVTHQEVLFAQFGRVHGLTTGPDGYFYVAVQNPTAGTTGIPMAASTPGQIMRLVPVAAAAAAKKK